MAPWQPPELPDDPDANAEAILDGLRDRLPDWMPYDGDPLVALASEVGREIADLASTALASIETAVAGIGETIFGVPALQAAAATARVRLTLSGSDTLGPDFLVVGTTTSGIEVSLALTDTIALPAGATEVTMSAVTAGEGGNGIPAGPLTVATATATVSAADAVSVSAGGRDAESLAAYLDRLADTLATLRFGGVRAEDLAALARSVVGVHRAFGVDLHNPGANEIQTIDVADATSGTFTLTFEGQTTAAIPFDAPAGAVQTELEALSNIAAGDVTVAGGPLGTAAVTVEFTGALRTSDRTQMTATSSLVGTGAAVTIATTQEGFAPTSGNERTATVFPVNAAGQPVSGTVKADLDNFLQGLREVNFIVHVADPTYTAITVDYTAVTDAGTTPATLVTEINVALGSYLSPANWGSTAADPQAWVSSPVVRFLDVARVIGSVPGVAFVQTLTLNGGSADVPLAGAAPLPAANAAISGDVIA